MSEPQEGGQGRIKEAESQALEVGEGGEGGQVGSTPSAQRQIG